MGLSKRAIPAPSMAEKDSRGTVCGIPAVPSWATVSLAASELEWSITTWMESAVPVAERRVRESAAHGTQTHRIWWDRRLWRHINYNYL